LFPESSTTQNLFLITGLAINSLIVSFAPT
jgi:hypothetical protein